MRRREFVGLVGGAAVSAILRSRAAWSQDDRRMRRLGWLGMNLALEGVTYQGRPVDDPEILSRLTLAHRALLSQLNGFVAYSGGLHVRGAVREPEWHSLRAAWDGSSALHVLYSTVEAMDVPFAQDALGDQFLLRDGVVYRLVGETGDLQSLDVDVGSFLEQVSADPRGYLNLAPLERFWADGGRLLPGQLLSVYPPFVAKESAAGVSLRAIPAADRVAFLASLARQLRDVPDGGRIEFKIE
jgi:hypothetical protein